MSENLFRQNNSLQTTLNNEIVELHVSENNVLGFVPPTYELPEGIGDSIERLDEAGQSNLKFARLPSGHFIRIHEDYTPVESYSRRTVDDVIESFAKMEFAVNNVSGLRYGEDGYKSTIHNHSGFRATQFSNGSGEMETAGRRVGLRTLNGLLIEEEWHFSRAWRAPIEYDARLPLTELRELLNRRDDETLFDIERVYQDGRKSLVVFRQGFGVFIGWDTTARFTRENSPMFGIRIEADEMDEIRTIDDVERRLLVPEAVREALTHGTPASPMPGTRIYSWKRNTRLELTDGKPNSYTVGAGTRIFRQGEWFFIPMGADFQPEGVVYKPLSKGADPRTVPEFDVFYGHLPVGNYEATTYNHKPVIRDLDSEQFLVPPTVFPCSTPRHMGSHVPRDISVELIEEDGEKTITACYVRGTVRHVEGDHPMYNLGERWFQAVRHDREALSIQRPESRRMGWD